MVGLVKTALFRSSFIVTPQVQKDLIKEVSLYILRNLLWAIFEVHAIMVPVPIAPIHMEIAAKNCGSFFACTLSSGILGQ